MGEFGYSVLLVAGVSLALAGFVWSWRNHPQMSRSLGLLGYWGMVVPTTRAGMCLAMSGIVILGLAFFPPTLLFYPDALRPFVVAAADTLIGAGLLIDLGRWARGRPGADSTRPKARARPSNDDPRRVARDRRRQR